jgi:hypothetical protein
MTVQQFVETTGWVGMLIALIDLTMLAVFMKNLIKRRPSWTPLWLGGAAVVAGILGTMIEMQAASDAVAQKGGAANPAELLLGVRDAQVDAKFGWASMFLALVLTGVLHACRRTPQSEEKAK